MLAARARSVSLTARASPARSRASYLLKGHGAAPLRTRPVDGGSIMHDSPDGCPPGEFVRIRPALRPTHGSVLD